MPPKVPAYVSIRQHTSAYVSMRQHASAYVSRLGDDRSGGEGEDADEVLVDIHTTRMQAYAGVCRRMLTYTSAERGRTRMRC
jgi:hypothetical protein